MSTTLFREIGPYKIEREIGRGGMALVFLATDTRSGRSVALKVVPDGTDAFPLDPSRSAPGSPDPTDTNPPDITLIEPANAVLVSSLP